jgi:molybdate transport system substrate-binding protein
MRSMVRAALVLLPGLLAACAACGNPAQPSAGKGAGESARANGELLIFAAASLTNVLEEIGRHYTTATRQPVKFSFASSSTLARQIESGARADVFISADTEWMEYLESRNRVDPATRAVVAGNRLVLVAPASSTAQLEIAPGFALRAALGDGRLATGDPGFVPVGRYARSALQALGVWDTVADRLVPAENVRAALLYVARGEAPFGIVYATDARVERRVRVVDVFPSASHPPITYPAALRFGARPGAAAFLEYLRGPGQATLRRSGFEPPPGS